MSIRKEQWRSNLSSYVIGKLCGRGKLEWVHRSVETKCLQKRGCGAQRHKRIHLCRDCRARTRNPRNRVGGRNGRTCLHRDRGTQECDPGSGLDGGGGHILSERGIGFCALPQSLSSGVWVIVNTTALALNNADTPCCEPTVLGRMQAFRLGDAHLLSGLHP